MTERIAIIDLGSNSARLIVMHIYNNGAYNLVYHQKESVRLSEGMAAQQLLQPAAMSRAIATLKIFAHMCQLFKVDKIMAVATAAVRNARNSAAFIESVLVETGISLTAINGETEAALGYVGVINTIDITDGVLFDLGGGSTEVTLIKDRKPVKVASLPFGAVNLSERFGTQDRVTDSQLGELQAFITEHLNERAPWLKKVSLPLIGVGGTARNIAKMEQKRKNYPFNKVHNYRLGQLSINDLWKVIVSTSLNQRQKFAGLSAERADIIIAGLTIVKCLSDTVQAPNLIISGCGVREGLFLQYYLSREGQPEVIPDILTHSTRNMLLFYKGNALHAYHVSQLAAAMFEGWQPLHKLGSREKSLLKVAALLHDIGITINYYDHARHSAYLVENARLFGLTHREQMLAAVIAGWHSGLSPKLLRYRIYSEFFDEADWQTARKLALLLALAESLDTTQIQIIYKAKATIKANKACLILYTDQPAPIELDAAAKHAKWFKKEFGADLLTEINIRHDNS